MSGELLQVYFTQYISFKPVRKSFTYARKASKMIMNVRIPSIFVDTKVVIDLPTANPRPVNGAKHRSKAGKPRTNLASKARKPRTGSASKAHRQRAKSPLHPLSFRLPGKKKAGKRTRRKNTNARVLGLLWLLPVGIPMMWQRSCTWRRGVKIAVTGVAAALVLALLILPFPTSNRGLAGGVEMVSGENEVEVYGPELPSYIVPGYVSESTDSIIVDTVENTVHYVYAADGAKCYHEYECKFAFASSQRLTVYEAYYLGYKPCPRCNPPKYDGRI